MWNAKLIWVGPKTNLGGCGQESPVVKAEWKDLAGIRSSDRQEKVATELLGKHLTQME